MNNTQEYINTPNEYKKNFVAVLDVLGFETITKANNPHTIQSQLKFSLNQANIICGKDNQHNTFNIKSKIRLSLFSDTLLLYTTDDSKISFKQITESVAILIHQSVINSIGIKKTNGTNNISFSKTAFLLRGAISFGDFFANEEDRIYFGPAFNEAIKLERIQDWIGAILTPECHEFAKSKNLTTDKFLIEYEAPLSEPRPYKNFLAINWANDFPDELINQTFFMGIDKDYQSKYKNTYKFLEYCRHSQAL